MVEVHRDINPELRVVRPYIHVASVYGYVTCGHKALSLSSAGFPDLVLLHDAPEVHRPSKGHENSKAVYPIDYYDGKDRILVSHLGPNSQSSKHYHEPPITEIYWLLAGKARVGERLIHEGGFVISPGEVHQVTTEEKGALLLILMKNAALVPEDRQHLYCQVDVGRWIKVRDSVDIPVNLPQ